MTEASSPSVEDETPTPPQVKRDPMWRAKPFKIAFAFWAFPIVLWLFSYPLWIFFRWEMAVVVWFFAFLTTPYFALVGAGQLSDLVREKRAAGSGAWTKTDLPAVVLCLLLFLNIAVGLALIVLTQFVDPHFFPG